MSTSSTSAPPLVSDLVTADEATKPPARARGSHTPVELAGWGVGVGSVVLILAFPSANAACDTSTLPEALTVPMLGLIAVGAVMNVCLAMVERHRAHVVREEGARQAFARLAAFSTVVAVFSAPAIIAIISYWLRD